MSRQLISGGGSVPRKPCHGAELNPARNSPATIIRNPSTIQRIYVVAFLNCDIPQISHSLRCFSKAPTFPITVPVVKFVIFTDPASITIHLSHRCAHGQHDFFCSLVSMDHGLFAGILAVGSGG